MLDCILDVILCDLKNYSCSLWKNFKNSIA